jgi:polysaccharide biosynthesis transport protein
MSDLMKIDPAPSMPQPDPAPTAPAWEEEPSVAERARDFYYRVILRHKWLILATVLVVLPLAAIQAYTTTPLYRATVTLQFDPNFSSVLPYKEIAARGREVTTAYMQAQAAALKSRILAGKVVARLELDRNLRFLEPRSEGFFAESIASLQSKITGIARSLVPRGNKKAQLPAGPAALTSERVVSMFLGDLEVEAPQPDSQILPVSFISHDPELANRLAEATVDEFINENSQSKYQATTDASQFLEKQIGEQKTKLEQAEEALISYAKAHGILDFDKERGEQTVMQRLSALNAQLTTVQAKLNGLKANYEMARMATPDEFPPVLNNAAIADLERRLSALKQNLATLLTRFGPRWPDVIQVKEQISQLEAQMTEEKKKAIEDSRSNYQTTVQEYKNALANLESQKRLAEQQNESLIQYKMLLRDENTNRQLYDALLQRSKEAGVSAGLKPDNIRIIDRRQAFPNAPFAPRTGLVLGIGFFVGLALGVGTAFSLTALDNTIKSPEELETTIGLPALGIIPTIRALKPAAIASAPDLGELAVIECEPHDPAIIPWRQLIATSGEPYRALRTAILLSHSDHPPGTILVTSALPSEGKTVTAVNLAIVLAQTGARTLVMEMDMRKPRLARMFGIENRIGMSVYLSGNTEEVAGIVKTAVPNLYIVPSGALPPNPAELIGSQRMKECLARLSQEFNYIVIDTPPVLPCTDAVVLSRCVDGVVLVARGGKTPRKVLENAAVQILSVGSKILGVVLNDLDLSRPEYSYHYGRYYRQYPYYRAEQK